MKRAALAVLLVSLAGAVAAVPAYAQTIYNNTGPNTDTGAPLYAYGVYGPGSGGPTTDSFTVGSGATVTGANFILWEYQGGATTDTSWDVNWSLGTSPFGTQDGTGTDLTPTSNYLNPIYLSVNNTSYYANLVTIPIPSTTLGPGTYWLTLGDTTDDQNYYAFWDASWPASKGSSIAYFSALPSSPVPSETFEIFGADGPTPTSVPEASPYDLPAVVGVLALVFLFYRRIARKGIRGTH